MDPRRLAECLADLASGAKKLDDFAPSDLTELQRFAAALRARANGKSTAEAYELVYGASAPAPAGDA